MGKIINFLKWVRGDHLIDRLLKEIKINRAISRSNFQPTINDKGLLRDEYKHNLKADFGLQVLIDNFEFESVLDVGSGDGGHSKMFRKAGKKVTALDYGKSIYFDNNTFTDIIIADFNVYNFNEQYDCVWASHILEHQLTPHLFLKKAYEVIRYSRTAAQGRLKVNILCAKAGAEEKFGS